MYDNGQCTDWINYMEALEMHYVNGELQIAADEIRQSDIDLVYEDMVLDMVMTWAERWMLDNVEETIWL